MKGIHSLIMARCTLDKLFWLCILNFCTQIMQCAFLCSSNSSNNQSCKRSEIISLPGHWPANYCVITNIKFQVSNKTITVNKENMKDLDKCFKIQDIWSFQPKQIDSDNLICDQVFPRGHFFTVYYYHGSNYFHLHYDTLIPLYSALYYQQTSLPKETVLLPAVEIKRGEGVDWNTDAFMKSEMYWLDMLMTIAGSHRLLPLDKRLAAINKTMCFERAYFGTPRVKYSDPSLIKAFINFVKKTLQIEKIKIDAHKPKVALIHREGRRKILNEDELSKSIESFAVVEIIDFSELSFKQQVQKVQEYSVLVGINGAGLTNALYLPESSVAVQLVPYKAQLNVDEFATLLKARGPYLQWDNTHSELNSPTKSDPFNNGSDTIVHKQEFIKIIKKALELQRNFLNQKFIE
ncbi:protein O-linked-mannose beta-1,4-N-acetylglucosaminyltransferase 2-like [Centruroides sculpturatus]|uniref:protein O-linked-mannose beta-1,4-N-acetylglucosaminyltransferase 2-like n=1 Tax=Centruroides sculpturatus TaxID=218467 RepID=UPI000C6CBC6D|nr:protein O-linked-mannose beta-1,4-N-acetylglucosaminyltransferase 2-like [Centruroides sculpturatus]XP_023241450.1 protein O-linked-mannose beta-1,4-N-acetylglucosaminyltransferase 2-like [Centruroides sculpturatus]